MRRIEQVNDLIREELGKIIDRDIELPDGAMVTLTRVLTSPDLHYSDIFVSVLPQASEVDVLALFAKAIGAIQRALNRKLRMRPVPRIKFVSDIQQKRAERIEKLLAKERLSSRGEN